MSILDAKLEMSDAQALSNISSGASTKSANVIDLGANGEDGWGNAQTTDPGEGGGAEWNVSVDTALVGSSAALTVTLVTKAADASISSGGTTIATLTIPAESAAGTKRSVKVPAGTVERYLGTLYTASGAKLTSAKLNSYLALDHSTV